MYRSTIKDKTRFWDNVDYGFSAIGGGAQSDCAYMKLDTNKWYLDNCLDPNMPSRYHIDNLHGVEDPRKFMCELAPNYLEAVPV